MDFSCLHYVLNNSFVHAHILDRGNRQCLRHSAIVCGLKCVDDFSWIICISVSWNAIIHFENSSLVSSTTKNSGPEQTSVDTHSQEDGHPTILLKAVRFAFNKIRSRVEMSYLVCPRDLATASSQIIQDRKVIITDHLKMKPSGVLNISIASSTIYYYS